LSLSRTLVLTAVVSLALGGGAALLLRERGSQAGPATAAAGNLDPSRARAPVEPPAPTGPISIELRGVPDGAQVTVDGIPVAGSTLELARDRRNRVIRVTAPEKAPWQAVHHASSDATYEVMLADAPKGVRPSPAPASRPRPKATRPARAPSALRQLDF
jgi:hypothetical protein